MSKERRSKLEGDNVDHSSEGSGEEEIQQSASQRQQQQQQQGSVQILNRAFKVGGGFTVTGHVETILPDVTDIATAAQKLGASGSSVQITNEAYDVKGAMMAGSATTRMVGPESSSNAASSSTAKSKDKKTAAASKRQDSYDLSGKGKGSVLIINNRFVAKKSKRSLAAAVKPEFEVSEREGSEKDVEATAKLFEDMGCLVYEEEDVQSTDLPRVLHNFKATCKDNNSSFCITILMTHGGDTELTLVMADLKEINIYKDLVHLFSQDNFDFKGRPKIFLIQACASYKSAGQSIASDGVGTVTEDGRRGPRRQLQPPPSPPSGELEDVFIGAACLPYRLSYRNTVSGSWYIQSIHEIFARCWRDKDLEAMHTDVETSVISKVDAVNKQLGQNKDKLQIQTPKVEKIRFIKPFRFPIDQL